MVVSDGASDVILYEYLLLKRLIKNYCKNGILEEKYLLLKGPKCYKDLYYDSLLFEETEKDMWF